MKKKPTHSWDIIIVCLMLLWYGHPLTSLFPILLRINSLSFNLGLKLLFLVLCVISLYKNRKFLFIRKNYVLWLGLGFMTIYSIRLYYDLLIRVDAPVGFDPTKAVLYGFLFCLFPFIFSAVSIKSWNIERFNKLAFYVLFINNITLLIELLYMFGSIGSIMESAQYARMSLGVSDTDLYVIDPIRMSSFGQVLASISLFNILTIKTKRYIYVIGFLLGGTILLLGASRGPLLAFLLLSLLTVFIVFRNLIYKLTYGKLLKLFGTIAIGFLVIILGNFEKIGLNSENFNIFKRFERFFKDRGKGVKEARDYEWESAWQQFLDSPIYGEAWLNRFDNYYPHNIYLEVLMATGLLGGIFFFPLLILLMYKFFSFYINARIEYSILFILAFTATMFHFLSGGLYLATSFWIFVFPFAILSMRKPTSPV